MRFALGVPLLTVAVLRKSSLVEFFVGMPLTLIKEDTGTRCPTKFFLQFNVDVKTPRCEIVKVPKEVSHLYPDVSVSSPMKADYKVRHSFLEFQV